MRKFELKEWLEADTFYKTLREWLEADTLCNTPREWHEADTLYYTSLADEQSGRHSAMDDCIAAVRDHSTKAAQRYCQRGPHLVDDSDDLDHQPLD
jgi:hypothetical protein